MTTLENNLKINLAENAKVDATTAIVRTKIICTIGPKTNTMEMIGKLVEAGMNVMRLNFSHGSHEYHASVISNLRKYLIASRRMCAIMLDTKGPEIRTGKLKDGKEVVLHTGQKFRVTSDMSVLGDETIVAQSYEKLAETVSCGSLILIDDGLIALQVERVEDNIVHCIVKNGGVLGETKGVNLPNASVDLPALTDKDVSDIRFGVEQKVDFIAASFIRKASDVEEIRETLKRFGGSRIKIIAKIENQQGLDNFDDILQVADGIMVARGDLGVEIPIEKVSLAQKMMISKCNVKGKPVITATQMLESMIKNPRPTRAETTDVANAVFDGSDCVMLSGETAKGDYPVETVQTMVAICREAESCIDYNYNFTCLRNLMRQQKPSITEVITSSAVRTAFDLHASLILCLTETGTTGRLVCKYRPVAPVICVTSNEQTARQLLINRASFPLVVGSMIGTESLIARCLVACKQSGIASSGDLAIVISGMKEGVAGATNLLRVVTIE
jgi:pyruvate kinase